jgi:hypothetical protein
MAGIWSSILNVEKVGIHDNFFSLGGDSISSILVVVQAQEKGLNISTQQFFQYPTINGLVKNMKDFGDEKDQGMVTDDSGPFSLISKEDRLNIPGGIEDAYPLRMLQVDFLLFSEFRYGSSKLHYIAAFKLKGHFNRELFETVVQRLVERHPVFRTTYDLQNYSQYLQLVHKEMPIPLVVEDLRGVCPGEQEEILAAARKNERTRQFDWETPTLVRFVIHILDDEAFHFMFSFHTSALDGWSNTSLLAEVFSTYNSLLEGKEPFEELKLETSLKDLLALELEMIRSEEAKNYWREFLKGSRFTKIPRQHRATAHAIDHGPVVRLHPVALAPGLSGKLQEAANQLEVPIKSILLASHSAVLGMLSETDDIVTGYEMNARPEKKDGEKSLGLFINVIPFRLKIPAGTWADLVKETYRVETGLLPYRRYPLAQLKEDLRRQQLFEVLFNFTHFRLLRDTGGLESIDTTLGEDLVPESEYVLRAEFARNALTRDIELTLHFHINVFEQEQIEHISRCYVKVLQQVSDNPIGPCEPGSLIREGKIKSKEGVYE